MRLDVDVFGAEDLLRPVARDVFNLVDKLAAAVVALARIAFRVLVGENAAGSFENRFRGEILACDQLDLAVLALGFLLNEPVNIRVGFGQRFDPFADLDRLTASMQARHEAMLRQLAAMERNAGQAAAVAGGQSPGRLIVNGNMPAGSQFTMVQSTTDANGCTRTVRYSSDGSSQQPQKIETSSGKCGNAEEKAVPAPAGEAPARHYVPGAI